MKNIAKVDGIFFELDSFIPFKVTPFSLVSKSVKTKIKRKLRTKIRRRSLFLNCFGTQKVVVLERFWNSKVFVLEKFLNSEGRCFGTVLEFRRFLF